MKKQVKKYGLNSDYSDNAGSLMSSTFYKKPNQKYIDVKNRKIMRKYDSKAPAQEKTEYMGGCSLSGALGLGIQ